MLEDTFAGREKYSNKFDVSRSLIVIFVKIVVRMKRIKQLVFAVIALLTAPSAVATIIPKPVSCVEHGKSFTINPSTAIVCTAKEMQPLVGYLREFISLKPATLAPESNYIALTLTTGFDKEAYRLVVTSEKVEISASDYGGLFNGIQTLFQLMPAKVYTKKLSLPAVVRGCNVEDKPQYPYRGFMLDVVRTWAPKEWVKHYIDVVAHHKINKFHWHLSDDQGWRIEIKSHPELTEIGGFRGGDSKIIASYGKWTERYGGFYTQDEIREVIDYAAIRNIEVIPEIDLPGHSWTLVTIHPEMLCNYSVSKDLLYDTRNVICATKQSNYDLIEEILAEVCALFPSKHIHIGGDEVNLSQWKLCPDCSAWLKENGYTDAHKLEDLFVEKSQAILAKYGKSAAVWNEATNGGGLSKDARVHGWSKISDCKAVLDKGYNTVFMTSEFFYLDMKQSKYEEGAPFNRPCDAELAYSFDLSSLGFTPENQSFIEGVESPFWSETFLTHGGDKSLDYIHYMTFPRLCAHCEIGWGKNGSDWSDFYGRLRGSHYDRMLSMGINFRLVPPKLGYNDGLLSASVDDGSVIYYREEGSSAAHRYTAPIKCDKPGKYIFWSKYRNINSPETAHPDYYKRIRPAVVVTSSIEVDSRYDMSRLSKYRLALTARTCRKGDWILYTFEKPVECREIKIVTGREGVTKRCIPNGYIEVSADGEKFKRVAQLINGCAMLYPTKGVKAIRLVSESDGNFESSVAINPPNIKPKW